MNEEVGIFKIIIDEQNLDKLLPISLILSITTGIMSFLAIGSVFPGLMNESLDFIGAILLGALGTFYPAWRASRTSPMEALRHE